MRRVLRPLGRMEMVEDSVSVWRGEGDMTSVRGWGGRDVCKEGADRGTDRGGMGKTWVLVRVRLGWEKVEGSVVGLGGLRPRARDAVGAAERATLKTRGQSCRL